MKKNYPIETLAKTAFFEPKENMPRCCKCNNNSTFEVRNLTFNLLVKKMDVEVNVPCRACKNCNATIMDNDQMNLLRRAAADRYREINHLLTSSEIKAYREKLEFSQIEFARFLRVGEASIKRWETYYIQDESQDDHMRVKCDPAYSESNCFFLQSIYRDSDIYSGNKTLSMNLIKQVSEFFKKVDSDCINHLRKLHFYTDFLHFKRYDCCITGMRYIPLKSGPAPHNFNLLTNFIQNKQFDSHKDISLDDNEKRTMEDVCDLFVRDKGELISNLSAKEKGFLETDETEFISYQYAKYLLI